MSPNSNRYLYPGVVTNVIKESEMDHISTQCVTVHLAQLLS